MIDDDAGIRTFVAFALEDEGHEVRTAPDGEAGLRAAAEFAPDVIVLDINMPVMDGPAFARAYAQVEPPPEHAAILVITAAGDAAGKARQLAAAGYLGKPFDLDVLLAAVADAVGESVPFDESEAAENARTAALVRELRAAGARDVRPSNRREWATFRIADGSLVQLYWWQRDGVYYVVRHAETGGTVERVGQVHDRSAAIALAMLAEVPVDGEREPPRADSEQADRTL